MSKNQASNAVIIGVVAVLVFGVLGLALTGSLSGPVGPQNKSQQGSDTGSVSPELSDYLAEFNNRLAKNPNDYEALVGVGNVFYDSYQFALAIDYYERALKINPNDTAVLVDTGTAYFYKQPSDPVKALEYYDRALEVDPKFENAMLNKGVVLRYGLNKYAEAIEAWETLVSTVPGGTQAARAKQLIEETRKLME